MPVNTGIEKLNPTSPGAQNAGFAWYDCGPNNSLNIHIANDGEVFYYGFNKTNGGTRRYRIKDPTGAVVLASTGIPTSGNGYINTYDEAVAGPSQIVGAAGYTGLQFTPLMTGDYTMEFESSTTLLYFDITVASTSNTAIPGRVWSRAWQLDTGTNPGESKGTFFIYTDDGLVTSMYLNGLQGITYTVACNQVGCHNPSGSGFTRKSVNGQDVVPQYKIFLNNPDINVYPTGTLGQLSNVLVTWNCNGTADITFDVTQAGTVDVLLDINPTPGQQAEDVLLSLPVTTGPNLITWDGLNGLLVQVPNGTVFNITVTYIMGLTNFPVYDVEQNANGLVINLIRPTGSTPEVYWDDTELERYIDWSGNAGCTASQFPPPPTSNYAGCPGSAGCHSWLSITECGESPCQCSYGNRNTVNSWWYAVFQTAPPVNFVEHRIPGEPISPVGPLQVCAGESGNTYTITAEPNSTTYTWEYTGTGATFNPPNPTGLTATIDFAPSATSGVVRVRGWNPECLDGAWGSTPVTIKPIPQITTPLTASICSGQTFQTLLTSNPTTVDFSWTTTCNPPAIFVVCPPGQSHQSMINDNISIIGINPGTVTYHITPELSGCIGQQENLVLDVSPLPDVITSPPSLTICSGEQTNVGLTSGIPGTGFTWIVQSIPPGVSFSSTTGSGDFLQVTITNTNTSPVTVIFDITPSINGCAAPPTSYSVTVNPTPHLTNNPPAPICSGSSINVSLTMDVTNPQNPYFSWTASCNPPGSVTGFPLTPVTGTDITDVLTNSTTDPATVTYEIIPFANSCQGVTASYSVTVNPTPHLSNLSSLPICSGATFSLNLTMDVNSPVNPYFEWTASCLPPGAANGFPVTLITGSTINDILNNVSDDDATVTYNITPYANNCQGPASGYPVVVHPVASVNPVTPQIICSGQQTLAVPLNSNVTTLSVDYSWTVSCDPTGIPVCPGNGSGNPIPQVAISNTDMSPRYATYTITPAVAGCPGTPLSSYQVQVNPSPTVTNNSLSQEMCSGTQSTQVILLANVSGTTFDWTVSSSSGDITGFVPGPGTGDIPVQTINNSSHTTQGYVDYLIIPSSQSGMSCPGAPATYRIYVNPLPDPMITGPLNVCYDQSGTVYSSPSVANHDFLWTVTGAVSFTGDHTNTINVDWGPGPSGTVQLTEVDQNFTTNCSTTTPVLNVVIHPAPNPTFLQGSPAVCQETSGWVYSTQTSMSNYIWTVSAGGTPTGGGTTTSSSVTVTWNIAGPQTVSVNYTNSDGCSAVNPTIYNVTVNPLPNSAITEAPGPACSSQSHNYSAPADPACSFNWSIIPPANGNIISGQGTNSVTINWLTSGPATVAVTATNNNTSCFTASTHAVEVNVSPAPVFSACFDLITTPFAKKFNLHGGMPYMPGQGTYSGSRVSFNPVSGYYEFNPFGAGPGSYPVTYTFTNALGCTVAATPVTVSVVNTTFTCNNDLIDVRDGNRYKTYLFGAKCWMTENLRTGTRLDLPLPAQTDNCTSEKYCLAADNASCTNYGGLYQWDELIQYGLTDYPYQGLCPPGWHVPTSQEWEDMLLSIANITPPDGIAGGYLNDQNPTTGFHALLKGIYYLNNSWSFTGGTLDATMFWTSSTAAGKPIARGLNSINPSVSIYESTRANAFSVRCVKD